MNKLTSTITIIMATVGTVLNAQAQELNVSALSG